MNKFTKAGIAGAAALAIATGGGTYALWSDYIVDEGNRVGADELRITLAGTQSGGNTFQFDKLNLAPGEKFDQENVITGRVGGADINTANAFITYGNLTQSDNGCGGTNAEEDADPNCANDGDGGELANEAVVTINRYAADCSTGLQSLVRNTTLADLAGDKTFVGPMSNGQQYCLKMTIALPEGATNRVMTDQVSFPIRYDLEQVPNA